MSEPAEIVHGFLGAIGARDIDAALEFFAEDGTWQNVPHPVAVGRDAIRAMLTGIVEQSSHVRWDIVSEAYSDRRAWVERVDRFWIDGEEYAVRCNGVLEIDPDQGVITELRDYVDLGEWRARVAGILR